MGPTISPSTGHKEHAKPTSLEESSHLHSSKSHDLPNNRTRQRLPPDVVRAFEQTFQANRNPSSEAFLELSHRYDIEITKVKTWFNNRKAKEKRLQSGRGGDPHLGSLSTSGSMAGIKLASSHSTGSTGSIASTPSYSSAASTSSLYSPGSLFDHVLTTVDASKETFSIDERYSTITLGMYLAMRNRICQLEKYIFNMSPPSPSLPMPSAAPQQVTPSARKQQMVPMEMHSNGNKIPLVPGVTVQSHINDILTRIKSELQKKKFSSLNDMVEIRIQANMSVGEFVAVFDEKGGTVSSVPKQPGGTSSENLVSVKFSTIESVGMVLGSDVNNELFALSATDDEEHRVPCTVQSLTVYYDKSTGQVSMSALVTASPSA